MNLNHFYHSSLNYNNQYYNHYRRCRCLSNCKLTLIIISNPCFNCYNRNEKNNYFIAFIHFLLCLVFNKLNFNLKRLFTSSGVHILIYSILPLLFMSKLQHVLANELPHSLLPSPPPPQLQQFQEQSTNLTNFVVEDLKKNFKFQIFDCNENNLNDPTSNNNNNNNRHPNNKYVKFNTELFYHELNMHETLVNLYKSCQKDFLKMNLDDFDDNYWNENSQIDNKLEKITDEDSERAFFCKRHEIFEEILYYLVNTQNVILNPDVANKMRYVCRSEVNLNNDIIRLTLLDKLFLLSSYEHDLCGNIFRNSMSRNHLVNDVLKLNSKRQPKSSDKSNQQTKSNKNTQQHKSASVLESSNLELKYLIRNLISSDQDQTQIAFLEASTKSIDNYLTYNYVNSHTSSNYNLTESRLNITKRDVTTASPSNLISTIYNHSHHIIKEIDNCTLILLNTYLLAYKSTCENRDFVASLSHYDCASNNFSVKSNCKLCQEAYARWLCSSNLPYFENGKLARSCQRYCFSVQNLCPFFRPMDDNFGAQPLFHCRNVVQVSEEKPDGYEDDDENYESDDIHDDDKCYSECSEDKKGELIQNDLDVVFRENLPPDSLNKNLSLIEAWFHIKSPLSTYYQIIFNEQARKTFNMNARYFKTKECIFNSVFSSAAPQSTSFILFRHKSNFIFVFFLILLLIHQRI